MPPKRGLLLFSLKTTGNVARQTSIQESPFVPLRYLLGSRPVSSRGGSKGCRQSALWTCKLWKLISFKGHASKWKHPFAETLRSFLTNLFATSRISALSFPVTYLDGPWIHTVALEPRERFVVLSAPLVCVKRSAILSSLGHHGICPAIKNKPSPCPAGLSYSGKLNGSLAERSTFECFITCTLSVDPPPHPFGPPLYKWFKVNEWIVSWNLDLAEPSGLKECVRPLN